MENLSKYTPTELLKLVNDTKSEHDALKTEIIDLTMVVEEKTILINKKLENLDVLEKKYITLIEELNNRNVI